MSHSIPEQQDISAVADLVTGLSRSIRRSLGHRLERLKLTHGRLRALRLLTESGTPLRMGELAERLTVVPRSATSLVDELAEAALVRRMPDPDDRRATLLELTAGGRRVLAEANRMHHEAAREVLGHLPSEDLKQLKLLLGRATGPI